jgi:hypothetical protein
MPETDGQPAGGLQFSLESGAKGNHAYCLSTPILVLMRDRDKNDKPIVPYKNLRFKLFVSPSSECDGAPGTGSGRWGSGGGKSVPAGEAGLWTTR